jgi:hypothetical protein
MRNIFGAGYSRAMAIDRLIGMILQMNVNLLAMRMRSWGDLSFRLITHNEVY